MFRGIYIFLENISFVNSFVVIVWRGVVCVSVEGRLLVNSRKEFFIIRDFNYERGWVFLVIYGYGDD